MGLKQTLPYWYSFRVALNCLGGCEVLLASTCMIKQTTSYAKCRHFRDHPVLQGADGGSHAVTLWLSCLERELGVSPFLRRAMWARSVQDVGHLMGDPKCYDCMWPEIHRDEHLASFPLPTIENNLPRSMLLQDWSTEHMDRLAMGICSSTPPSPPMSR